MKIDQVSVCAELICSFIAKQDLLSDEESQQLAEWIKEQEPHGVTNAEKHCLIALRAFVLDYPAELTEAAPLAMPA